MNIELKKIAGIGAILAALAVGPAMAGNMTDWDGDRDGSVNQEEFNKGWGNRYGDGESAFSSWDNDKDGMLSEDEYNSGVYNSYDRDRNGMIDEPEFGDVGDDMGDGGFWDI